MLGLLWQVYPLFLTFFTSGSSYVSDSLTFSSAVYGGDGVRFFLLLSNDWNTTGHWANYVKYHWPQSLSLSLSRFPQRFQSLYSSWRFISSNRCVESLLQSCPLFLLLFTSSSSSSMMFISQPIDLSCCRVFYVDRITPGRWVKLPPRVLSLKNFSINDDDDEETFLSCYRIAFSLVKWRLCPR